ncbi:MAG: PAS domain-containing protein [Oscillospiraceae bacterium]|jgi:two-component system phosphate regulon sensor histidine kinase PhoR|nr:PAS domain-containing protein [Oscillospiraceae bacterium]
MKRAIFYRLLALSAVAIVICSVLSAAFFSMYMRNETRNWLVRLTLAAAAGYDARADAAALSQSAGGLRVTIVAPNGTVLDDSEADADRMENHAGRDEIEHARLGRPTVAVRDSHTLGRSFMYAAVEMPDGNVLRLAHDYAGALSNMAVQLPGVLAAAGAALVLAVFLAGRFSRAVTSPLEKVMALLAPDNLEALTPIGPESAAALSELPTYYEIEHMMRSIRRLLGNIAQSHRSLLAEREKIESILSNMAEGFVLIDGQKKILLCNQSAKLFFGCREDVVSKDILTLIRDPDIHRALDDALRHGRSSALDRETPGGLVLHVSVSPAASGEAGANGPGTGTGATVMLLDITPARRLEEQKRDFFSNASHELKTPITSILGFSEMLSRRLITGESERDEVLQRIETEARRMSGLIGDILTVSDLESRRAPPDSQRFDFAEVVREAVDSVSPVRGGAAIEITAEVESVPVRANRRQLHELCVNLIENAVKYNKPGGQVHITLQAAGRAAVLVVRDTGIGIPPEHQARVFERFFRVDAGRDKKVGGTGLGLSIVKHIVNLYGGEISLQSQKDVGTRIEVRLPVAEDTPEDAPS